ncbi:MAG: cell division protein FtsL [Desulfomonilia bacterium]
MKNLRAQDYLPMSVILILFLMVWSMCHVGTRHLTTELGYAISDEQDTKEQLIMNNKALRLEISTLKSSKRLELIAKKELGLSEPRSDQVVYLWLDE